MKTKLPEYEKAKPNHTVGWIVLLCFALYCVGWLMLHRMDNTYWRYEPVHTESR